MCWGWRGDYTGRRLAIVRFGAVCTLASFSLIFVSHTYAWLALVMALHAFFWHAVLPQFEVITLAHLQKQTSRYSQIRLLGSCNRRPMIMAAARAAMLAILKVRVGPNRFQL